MRKRQTEGVCGLGFTPDRKNVILIKRRDSEIWELPHGGKESGESWEEAVRREVKEETGLDFQVERLQGAYEIRFPEKNPFYGDVQQVYLGTVTGSPKINEEAKEVRYFNPSTLPCGFAFWQKQYVDDALKGAQHSSPVIQEVRMKDVIKMAMAKPQVVRNLLKFLWGYIN